MTEQENKTSVDAVHKIIGALNWLGDERTPVVRENTLKEDAKIAEMVERASKILADNATLNKTV